VQLPEAPPNRCSFMQHGRLDAGERGVDLKPRCGLLTGDQMKELASAGMCGVYSPSVLEQGGFFFTGRASKKVVVPNATMKPSRSVDALAVGDTCASVPLAGVKVELGGAQAPLQLPIDAWGSGDPVLSLAVVESANAAWSMATAALEVTPGIGEAVAGAAPMEVIHAGKAKASIDVALRSALSSVPASGGGGKRGAKGLPAKAKAGKQLEKALKKGVDPGAIRVPIVSDGQGRPVLKEIGHHIASAQKIKSTQSTIPAVARRLAARMQQVLLDHKRIDPDSCSIEVQQIGEKYRILMVRAEKAVQQSVKAITEPVSRVLDTRAFKYGVKAAGAAMVALQIYVADDKMEEAFVQGVKVAATVGSAAATRAVIMAAATTGAMAGAAVAPCGLLLGGIAATAAVLVAHGYAVDVVGEVARAAYKGGAASGGAAGSDAGSGKEDK